MSGGTVSGSGRWMDTVRSRSILCSCSMLWHRAGFWEQSWLQGLLGTGCVQGCAGPTDATSSTLARALQDQGHQEREKSLCKGVGGRGSSTAAPRAAGASQGAGPVCWVLAVGQSRLLACSGLWAEELGRAGRWCWMQDAGAGLVS